jgi:hypothetical protein
MKMAHDQNILRRSFEPGQKVLLYNEQLHLFPGKLRSRWTSPFIVRSVPSYGAIEKKKKIAMLLVERDYILLWFVHHWFA